MSLVKRKIDEIIKKETNKKKKKRKKTLFWIMIWVNKKKYRNRKKGQEERKNSRSAPSLEKDSEEAKDMLNQEDRDAVKTNFHFLQK